MNDLTISDLVPSFERHIIACNLSPKTRLAYVGAVRKVVEILGDREVSSLRRSDLEEFLGLALRRYSSASVHNYYRGLLQFFKWAVRSDELDASPMDGLQAPMLVEKRPDVLDDSAIGKLLDATRGRSFESRRDRAMIMLFLDTGARLSEVALVRLDQVFISDRRMKVWGKGRRERTVRFGAESANALELYVTARRRHARAADPALWLGPRGGMTANGVYQMVRRRASQAGVRVHPHQFRHTFAHLWLSAGGGEGDLQTLAGWRSRQMLARYASTSANERALAAYDRVLPARRSRSEAGRQRLDR